MESIQLIGSSGHSSNPDLGINAIDGMHWILNKLHVWRAELQEKHQDTRYKIPHPTINFGCIHGGDNPNKICEACELHIDLRFLPSMSIPEIRTNLALRLKPIEKAFPGMQLKIKPLFPGLPAFEQTNEKNALVSAVEELTQESSTHVLFGTEAPFLQALGMEPLVMGPGNIEQAHQPNEYIELDQIKPAIQIIESLIKRFCLAA